MKIKSTIFYSIISIIIPINTYAKTKWEIIITNSSRNKVSVSGMNRYGYNCWHTNKIIVIKPNSKSTIKTANDDKLYSKCKIKNETYMEFYIDEYLYSLFEFSPNYRYVRNIMTDDEVYASSDHFPISFSDYVIIQITIHQNGEHSINSLTWKNRGHFSNNAYRL